MRTAEQRPALEEAFERIEETILPGISMMLDAMLDATLLARSGIDAQVYAAELRTLALQLEELIQEVESISPAHIDPQEYRAASAA